MIYMTASDAQEKGYDRIDKHPKSSRYGRQNPITEQWNSEEQLCIWRANWADLSLIHICYNEERISLGSLLDSFRNQYQNWLEIILRQNYNSGGFLVPICW